MPAKGKPSGNPSTSLQGKAYKESLSELFASTALQARDLDQKAMQLMDALQKAGKGEAAIAHLKTSLEGIVREKVQNWRAYIYSLLRAFDSDVYNAMKEKSGGNRRQQGQPKNAPVAGQNTSAVEFVPGSWWGGDASQGTIAPAMPVMPYPMNMMMMMPQMMVPQMQVGAGGYAPPPPPAKAAEVPQADADPQAPAPDKPADASVPDAAKDEAAPAEAKDAR